MPLRNPVCRLGALALVVSMAVLAGPAQAAVPRSGIWRAEAVDATGQRALFKFTVARSERYASGKSVFFKQPNGFRLPIARPDVLDANCKVATGVFGPTEAHIRKHGTFKAPFDRSGSWVGNATIKGRFVTSRRLVGTYTLISNDPAKYCPNVTQHWSAVLRRTTNGTPARSLTDAGRLSSSLDALIDAH